MKSTTPPLREVRWNKTFRLVPTRYPPVDLFERVADPADWELVAHIEGLTNDRLREATGDISLVPVAERVSGPGASVIMAPFTHLGSSRFSSGAFGVYYASNSFEGAFAEVLYHRALFLLRTKEPKTELDFRTYVGKIRALLHDIRGGFPLAHAPDTYVHSQALGKELHDAGSNGVVFNSVRRPPADNIGVFRPSLLAARHGKPHVVQSFHVRVEWDGARMSRYIVMGEPDWKELTVTRATASRVASD